MKQILFLIFALIHVTYSVGQSRHNPATSVVDSSTGICLMLTTDSTQLQALYPTGATAWKTSILYNTRDKLIFGDKAKQSVATITKVELTNHDITITYTDKTRLVIDTTTGKTKTRWRD